MRDAIFSFAAAALWRPRREVNAFAAEPGARIDLMLAFGAAGSRAVVVADVAVVSPLAASNLAAAAASPGGAAARHEATKVARYGALARAARVELTPLCVDTFGAWGPSALPLLRRLARDWGRQFDLHPSRAVPLVLGALSSHVAAAVAALLLQGAASQADAGVADPRAVGVLPLPVCSAPRAGTQRASAATLR
ncbi:MAG: hypothetical protein EKK45_10170 [Curvibacter sp.]|nr:MAG: hypothetical protein EKK45_10170 [Curvibacter sp.]